MKMVRELNDITYQEMLKNLGLFSLQKRRWRGGVIAVCNYKVRGYREDGSSLFSDEHGDRANSNEHMLEHGKFQSDIRKKKIYHEDGQVPDGIAHRVWRISILEGSHNSAGHSPKHPDLFRAALNSQLDYMTPESPSQPKLFYDSLTGFAIRTDANKSCRYGLSQVPVVKKETPTFCLDKHWYLGSVLISPALRRYSSLHYLTRNAVRAWHTMLILCTPSFDRSTEKGKKHG